MSSGNKSASLLHCHLSSKLKNLVWLFIISALKTIVSTLEFLFRYGSRTSLLQESIPQNGILKRKKANQDYLATIMKIERYIFQVEVLYDSETRLRGLPLYLGKQDQGSSFDPGR